MLVQILLLVLGFVLLIKGADFLVDGASNVAKKLHIPEIVIGLTIVSIGTSMPELFVSITSALEGYPDMALGNVIGSNIANLLLILGLTSFVKPIVFKEETLNYEIPACLFTTFMLYILANSGNVINKLESIALMACFVVFLIYTFILAKHKREKNKVVKSKTPILLDIIFIILGVVGLKFGGDFTVNNAVKIAATLGLSEKIISVTILAVGTSLPELVTSISAARKNSTDLAIGNIIGSNIFNILLIIGVSSFIKPIIYNISYNRDLVFLFFSIVSLLIFSNMKPRGKMSRSNGLFYFVFYIVYILFLFVI